MTTRYGVNTRYVWDALIRHGMSQIGAAGILGNLRAESGTTVDIVEDINPGARQPRGPGRGIAQWSQGDRWDHAPLNCVGYCRTQGLEPWSIQGQTSFLIAELQAMDVWHAVSFARTIDDAAAYVMNHYEMPASRDPSRRQTLARDVYQSLHPVTIVPKPFILRRVLHAGCEGDDVRHLQAALSTHAYPVNVDGVFGTITLGAVRRFQSTHGLAVDGEVGPKTAAKLGWLYD